MSTAFLIERRGSLLLKEFSITRDMAQRRAEVMRDRIGEGLQLFVAEYSPPLAAEHETFESATSADNAGVAILK